MTAERGNGADALVIDPLAAPRGGSVLRVRAQPNAKRDALAGVRDGKLCVQLRAPAHEGRANAALIELLARALGCRRSELALVAGERARDKRVALPLPPALARERVAAALAEAAR
jgi:uncharacterized protein (TIGR00251 family)